MEIEKKRETSWKISLKDKEKYIELTSVEIGGEVRDIKFSLLKNDNAITIEMSKDEFFNFLSLIHAFKDVVMGTPSTSPKQETRMYEKISTEPYQEPLEEKESFPKIELDTSELNSNKDEKEDLNPPEEWDPW
ncbi:MAG: hypothetical protein ACTSW3_03220 [Promethearchaeota archaeon]